MLKLRRFLGLSFFLFPSCSVASDNPLELPRIVIFGRRDSLLRAAESAAQGAVGAEQLSQRPLLRNGEVLETVPGVIVTQHSGAGKANQFFLRGFNLDHGTDFATCVDGMPVNLPSHGHGQGYSDLNFLIPELVERVDFQKGPYFADTGDFSSAGASQIEYSNELLGPIVSVHGGSFSYGRGFFAASPKLGDGRLLYALEASHDDGPWDHPDSFKRGNGVLRYTRSDGSQSLSVMAMGYKGEWDSTDQVARRAVDQGLISRFGSLDTTDGGDSQRYSLSARWRREDDRSLSQVSAYGIYYDLALFSNFTYFKDDPVDGDQFEQKDRRWIGGLDARHQDSTSWFGREVRNEFGGQMRYDGIRNGLFHTSARRVLSTTREDRIRQLSAAPFVENSVRWSDQFRSVAGIRADLYSFDVRSDRPENSGDRTAAIASPKLGLVFGPFSKTEFYLNGGLGFHSNDARGVTTRLDPATTLPVPRADPLVRTKGAEAGVRTLEFERLQSTLALWVLDIDSELVFVGDAGTTQASRPSRRVGVEWANYYAPLDWLSLDADLSVSRARFREDDPAGDHIPGSIETVLAAGVSLKDLKGFFGELRLRYFGPRPLIEDDSVRSKASALVNSRLGYSINKTWSVAAEVFNLFDSKASDIDYYYPSLLRGEAAGPDDGGYNDIHTHPALPRLLRISLEARF